MFNIIPLILILASLAIIIVIVVRKFSVLANIDIDTIQAEREAKFKEQIISNRLKRTYIKYYSKLAKAARPVGSGISGFFKWSFDKLVEFKENYNKEEKAKKIMTDPETEISRLIGDAEEAIKKENFDSAEKILIDVISLDSKNIKAFKMLGNIYFEKKNFSEARQTLEHVLRLSEKDLEVLVQGGGDEESRKKIDYLNNQLSDIYFDLSLIMKAEDSLDRALRNIVKALAIEPNNPRYLDTKVEISIMKKDRANALEAFDRLAKANPDNKKLADFKKMIDQL